MENLLGQELKYVLYAPVWGKEHIDVFLQYSLSSILAPGNLPYLTRTNEVTYVIYTNEEDIDYFNSQPQFQHLKTLVKTEIIPISTALAYAHSIQENAKSKYSIVAACTNHCSITYVDENTVFAVLVPDVVVSDGAFKFVHEQMCSGKRMVTCPCISVSKETFTTDIIDNYGGLFNYQGISSSKLVGLGLKHLHPMQLGYFIDSQNFAEWPASLYSKVDETGFLVRGFHFHPWFVRPRRKGIISCTTMDANYTLRTCPNFEDIAFATDSDQISLLELSPTDRHFFHSGHILDVERVKHWSALYSHSHQRRGVLNSYKFHSGELSNDWTVKESFFRQLAEYIVSDVPEESFNVGSQPTTSVDLILIAGEEVGLSNQLKAVVAGDARPDKVIIVNRSIDRLIVASLAKSLPFPSCVINVPDSTCLGECIELGLSEVHSEYCAVLCKDEYPTPEWLELSLDSLRRFRSAAVCFSNVVVKPENHRSYTVGPDICHSESFLNSKNFIQLCLARSGKHLAFQAPTAVMKTERLRAIGTTWTRLNGSVRYLLPYILGVDFGSTYVHEVGITTHRDPKELWPTESVSEIEKFVEAVVSSNASNEAQLNFLFALPASHNLAGLYEIIFSIPYLAAMFSKPYFGVPTLADLIDFAGDELDVKPNVSSNYPEEVENA